MNNNIENFKNFISNLDMSLIKPIVHETVIRGRYQELKLEKIEITTGNEDIKLDNYKYIQLMLFFSVLDDYFDMKDNNLIGKSYGAKCKEIDPKNNEEKIALQVFRVFKIMRNAIVHVKDDIFNDESIYISYEFRNTEYLLNCTINAFKMGCSIIHLIVENDFPTCFHKEIYLLGMYKKFLEEISLFKDEFSGLDETFINKNYNYRWKNRRKILNPKFEVSGNNLFIDKISFSNSADSYDYFVELSGQKYLIPEEIISEERKVQLSGIEKYEMITK